MDPQHEIDLHERELEDLLSRLLAVPLQPLQSLDACKGQIVRLDGQVELVLGTVSSIADEQQEGKKGLGKLTSQVARCADALAGFESLLARQRADLVAAHERALATLDERLAQRSADARAAFGEHSTRFAAALEAEAERRSSTLERRLVDTTAAIQRLAAAAESTQRRLAEGLDRLPQQHDELRRQLQNDVAIALRPARRMLQAALVFTAGSLATLLWIVVQSRSLLP